MASRLGRLHTSTSSALGTCATPLLERVWPWILGQTLLQSGFREKAMTSLLSGMDHALIIAPHPDDEFFGCPDLLLALGESGIRVTLAVILDGRGQASGCSISRLDMSSNAARLNGWSFASMGWPDGFSRKPDHDIVAPLAEFLSPYLAGDQRAGLIILPILCDYHPDHRAIASAILNILSKLPNRIGCPDIVLYWTFSAPIRIPECAQVVRVDGDRSPETKHRWMLEYGTVVSPDAADRNRLIRAAVSKACWGKTGCETVFWVSGSHVKQLCLEARGGGLSCVRLNGSRIIIPNTIIYGLKAAFSKVSDR